MGHDQAKRDRGAGGARSIQSKPNRRGHGRGSCAHRDQVHKARAIINFTEKDKVIMLQTK